MKTVAKIALYIAAVLALAFLGDIAYAAHYASMVAAANGQPTGWTWTDIGALLGALGAFLAVVSTVLHIIAPKTKTTLDDEIAQRIDQALEFMRSQEYSEVLRFVRGNNSPLAQASRADTTVVQIQPRITTAEGVITSASARDKAGAP